MTGTWRDLGRPLHRARRPFVLAAERPVRSRGVVTAYYRTLSGARPVNVDICDSRNRVWSAPENGIHHVNPIQYPVFGYREVGITAARENPNGTAVNPIRLENDAMLQKA